MQSRMLIIDDNEAFVDILKKCLDAASVSYDLEWQSNVDNDTIFNHDIYILDNRLDGALKAPLIIDKIRKQDAIGPIIIISSHRHSDTLKDLINKHVSGFIDKNNNASGLNNKDQMDITILLQAMKETRLRDKLKSLHKISEELNTTYGNGKPSFSLREESCSVGAHI